MFEIKSIFRLPILSFRCSEIRSCEQAGVAQSTCDILLIYKRRDPKPSFMASITLKLPVHSHFCFTVTFHIEDGCLVSFPLTPLVYR